MALQTTDAHLLCPDESTLSKLLNKELPHEEAVSLERHVEECDACQQVLERLVGSLSGSLGLMLERQRQPSDPDEAPPLGDDYEVVGPIDAGGMGVVWRVRDLQFQRPLAVKVMKAKAAGDQNSVRRFLAEARITSQLAHPFIVPVHTMGCLPDGRHYYTMKLVEGKTLEDLLRERPDPAARRMEFVQIFGQVCQAMAHAHGRSVLHRDLKPANVMVGGHGEVQVMDWGLAKVLAGTDVPQDDGRDPDETVEEARYASDGHTAPNSLLGTLYYMSPEAARGEVAEVDQRSDVFGLGAILCVILTGAPPYTGRDFEAVRLAAAEARLGDALGRLRGCGADAELIQLAERCLAPRKSDRPADAGEVAAAVAAYQAAVQERLHEAEMQGAAATARLLAERQGRRLAVRLMGLVVVVLLLGLTTTTYFFFDSRAEAEKYKTKELEAERSADVARANAKRAAYRAYLSDIRFGALAWASNERRRLGELLAATEPAQTEGEDFRGFEWFLLRRLWNSHRDSTLGQIPSGFRPMSIDPGGQLVAGARVSSDPQGRPQPNEVIVWNARSGQVTLSRKAHEGLVSSVSFAPNGKRLASASQDGTVIVWDVLTGRELHVLEGRSGVVSSVCFTPDCKLLARATGGPVASGAPGEIRVWDVESGKTVSSFVAHGDGITAICFSPDGKLLASGSWDKTVKVWDAQTGREQFQVKVTKGHPRCLSFNREGTRLAWGCESGEIHVWDAVKPRALIQLWGVAAINSLCYSPDGKLFASASDDNTVRLFQASDGRMLFQFRGHTDRVTCVSFISRSRLASVSDDGTIQAWDAQAFLPEETVFQGHTSFISRLSFTPDGKQLASASEDGKVLVWDMRTGAKTRSFQGHTQRITRLCFSPDGKWLATAGADNNVKVWDARTWQQAHAKGHDGAVRDVSFSSDSELIVSVDDTVRAWNFRTGQESITRQVGLKDVYLHTLNRGGTRLAGVGRDNTVRVWDTRSEQQEVLLLGHQGQVSSLCFSPDGLRLACIRHLGPLQVWDLRTGREELHVNGHAGNVYFSPDGNRLVTTTPPMVRLLDVRTGEETLALRGPIGFAVTVCFSSDGTRLASAWPDKTVRVWDAPRGQ